jgi:type 1 fimbria pilin
MYIDAGFGAISQQNINEGSFSAVANFTIEYE